MLPNLSGLKVCVPVGVRLAFSNAEDDTCTICDLPIRLTPLKHDARVRNPDLLVDKDTSYDEAVQSIINGLSLTPMLISTCGHVQHEMCMLQYAMTTKYTGHESLRPPLWTSWRCPHYSHNYAEGPIARLSTDDEQQLRDRKNRVMQETKQKEYQKGIWTNEELANKNTVASAIAETKTEVDEQVNKRVQAELAERILAKKAEEEAKKIAAVEAARKAVEAARKAVEEARDAAERAVHDAVQETVSDMITNVETVRRREEAEEAQEEAERKAVEEARDAAERAVHDAVQETVSDMITNVETANRRAEKKTADNKKKKERRNAKKTVTPDGASPKTTFIRFEDKIEYYDANDEYGRDLLTRIEYTNNDIKYYDADKDGNPKLVRMINGETGYHSKGTPRIIYYYNGPPEEEQVILKRDTLTGLDTHYVLHNSITLIDREVNRAGDVTYFSFKEGAAERTDFANGNTTYHCKVNNDTNPRAIGSIVAHARCSTNSTGTYTFRVYPDNTERLVKFKPKPDGTELYTTEIYSGELDEPRMTRVIASNKCIDFHGKQGHEIKFACYYGNMQTLCLFEGGPAEEHIVKMVNFRDNGVWLYQGAQKFERLVYSKAPPEFNDVYYSGEKGAETIRLVLGKKVDVYYNTESKVVCYDIKDHAVIHFSYNGDYWKARVDFSDNTTSFYEAVPRRKLRTEARLMELKASNQVTTLLTSWLHDRTSQWVRKSEHFPDGTTAHYDINTQKPTTRHQEAIPPPPPKPFEIPTNLTFHGDV